MIIQAMRDYEIVLSVPILKENKAVVGRFGRAMYREGLFAIIGELERGAVLVEPSDVAFGLADPDDEVCLATATAGGAALITGNSRHFTQAR